MRQSLHYDAHLLKDNEVRKEGSALCQEESWEEQKTKYLWGFTDQERAQNASKCPDMQA